MQVCGLRRTARLPVVALLCAVGCQTPPGERPEPEMTGRRARAVAQERLAQTQPTTQERPAYEIPARMIGPAETQPAVELDEIFAQVPDPLELRQALELENKASSFPVGVPEEAWRASFKRYADDVLHRVNNISRHRAVRLSLAEAVRRSVINSYAIQTQSYNPAIETTRIVEAEAAFDAVLFSNFNYTKQNQPTSSQLQSSVNDTRTFQAGVRKLLSSGMQVQASYVATRTETNLAFQTLNPAYFNQFVVEFNQPLLRGFGIDFNRAQIEISRIDRDVAIEQLRRNIRETIFNVEQAYWRLFQARRNVAITARVLSNFHRILGFFEKRLEAGYDVYPVQVNLIRSRIENRQAQFVRFSNDVKNAEDALKRLLNDPELNQAADIEIIPTQTPAMSPIVLDQLGELTAALQNRTELREAKLRIQQAQISIGVAKNQALPRLDLLFRYIVDGLGANMDRAFSQLSEHDFNEYVLQLQFEWPIGNRGPEAALRRSRLQQAQAIAAHRDAIEQVITEVNTAIRDLQTSYDQIGPSYRGARASQEQLRATVLRGENLTPEQLQVELDANESLAGARTTLVQVIAEYNIAMINLERRKDTLLDFNNIKIRGIDEDKYVQPYKPIGP